LSTTGTAAGNEVAEATRQHVSGLLHRWQAACEEYLVVVQVRSIVRTRQWVDQSVFRFSHAWELTAYKHLEFDLVYAVRIYALN
jgi:hypothetical protein